jgi:hypothetical protein
LHLFLAALDVISWREQLRGLLNLLLRKWAEGDIPLAAFAEFIVQNLAELK